MTMTAFVDACVIVPTYNRAQYLAECLEALLDQTIAAKRIIVVDDGSSDDTAAVVGRFASRVEYVHQINAGKATALNRGLRMADAELIWIVDDDDVVARDALVRLSAALLADPSTGFSFGDFDRFSITPDKPSRSGGQPFDQNTFQQQQMMQCTVFQPSMLVRKRCYDETGPFDEALFRTEDYDMLLRLSARYDAAYVDGIVFHQRQHDGARGPAQMRIDGAEVWQRQLAFDAEVFERVHRRGELREFLPRSESETELSPAKKCRALLFRAAMMAKRHLWDLARSDIAEALQLAEEADVSSMPAEVADLYSEGYWAQEPGAATLGAIVARRASPLRRQLSEQLSWAYLSNAGRAMRKRDWVSAKRHATGYLRDSRGSFLLEHAGRATRRLTERLRRRLKGSQYVQ